MFCLDASDHEADPLRPMRLKLSSYQILGMLNLGLETGYEVKRTVDRSTRLHSDRVPAFEFRDVGLLRLFFADAIPLADAHELVKRLSVRAEEIEAEFRAEIYPYAERSSTSAKRFPFMAAREGAGASAASPNPKGGRIARGR
jgi:hypothetical protein